MKRDNVFIIVCSIMLLCGYFGRDYPYICILVAYSCGGLLSKTHKSPLLDYINKKLN